MQQDDQITLRFLRAIVLVVLATVLSACAGRPKPLDPTRPVNVTEVRVMAYSIEDLGFAGRLQQRLEASVGRATSDIGQASALRIVVQERRQEPSPVNLFGGISESVSLDLSLIDSNTGQVLRSQALRSNSTDFNGSSVETVLISRLTDDIRGLLGLSGYTPFPVRGAKRDVVWPSRKPVFDAADETLRSVDPLLNGTVTPTTLTLDVEPDTAPAIDYSKPLLDDKPTVKPSIPAIVMAPEVPEKVPGSLELPAQKPGITPTDGDTDDLDEPCIITLDNDCSDPDSR